MIQLTHRQQYLISQDDVQAFLCVKIKDIFITDYPSDLMVGSDRYISSDMIYAVDNIQMVSSVERDLYTIRLTDSNRNVLPLLENTYYGATVEVKLGIVDNATGIPDTTAMFHLYGGVFESYNSEINLEEAGSILLNIQCSNQMSSLDETNVFYVSKTFMRNLSPNDTSFDQIYEGSGGVSLAWGKK